MLQHHIQKDEDLQRNRRTNGSTGSQTARQPDTHPPVSSLQTLAAAILVLSPRVPAADYSNIVDIPRETVSDHDISPEQS